MSRVGPVLALVPARGGSKGIPRKNLRELCGRPLISWTLGCATAARGLTDVIVSTDDPEIADTARACGADVPFMRPPELSSDTATSLSVIEHAVEWLADRGRQYGAIVLLEPTSPLREPADIEAAITLLATFPTVVSVCRAESIHPAFMYRREDDGLLRPYQGNGGGAPRRQDTEPVYFLDGSIYASHLDVLLERRSFYHASTYGYVVPKWKSLEIDDETDLVLVEAMMRHKGCSQ